MTGWQVYCLRVERFRLCEDEEKSLPVHAVQCCVLFVSLSHLYASFVPLFSYNVSLKTFNISANFLRLPIKYQLTERKREWHNNDTCFWCHTARFRLSACLSSASSSGRDELALASLSFADCNKISTQTQPNVYSERRKYRLWVESRITRL